MTKLNIIDRLATYFDRKGDSFGQRYTRCLIGFLFAWCALGFVTGLELAWIVGAK
ncbi:hypothetical protein [Fimbriiglobus ruber]|uniref:hypothetical protein n=1 Tax=Fimbriiglobus ruber TaxID=1908690 RepID=UPI00137B757C|nr:hypothetical protein [Fimbriiglobus ruber]